MTRTSLAPPVRVALVLVEGAVGIRGGKDERLLVASTPVGGPN